MFFVEAGDLNTAIRRSYNARYQGKGFDHCAWAQRARGGPFHRKRCLAAGGLRQRALRISLNHRGLLDDYFLGQRDLNVSCILRGEAGSGGEVAFKTRSELKPSGRTAAIEFRLAMNIRDCLAE